MVKDKMATCGILFAQGFTTRTRMKNVEVVGPPKAGAFKKRPAKQTQFRRFYDRGDLPIALEHDTKGNKIAWKVEIEKLDYHHYLPMFFEGKLFLLYIIILSQQTQ